MLDLKFIRENKEIVEKALEKRGAKVDIGRILDFDESRRKLLTEVEEKKSLRNSISKEIGLLKKEGKDPSEVMHKVGDLGDSIKDLDSKVREVDEELGSMLLLIPNVPHESVPVGLNEEDFRLEKVVGEPKKYNFEVKAHWDLGENLNILDFERATKVTGARFTFYRGMAARLERALVSFMLNTHSNGEYTELLPPFMVNSASMTGTGQLPKFAEDMFKLENTDYYLVPTAEVPVTNYYRDEISL
jgi:seryl-tRNA synthetase